MFRQDGRRVFERGVLRRPARVSRTNPFPRPRPPFPAMKPPPSVCLPPSASLRLLPSVCCPPSVALRLLLSVSLPPSAAFRLPPSVCCSPSATLRQLLSVSRLPSAAPSVCQPKYVVLRKRVADKSMIFSVLCNCSARYCVRTFQGNVHSQTDSRHVFPGHPFFRLSLGVSRAAPLTTKKADFAVRGA